MTRSHLDARRVPRALVIGAGKVGTITAMRLTESNLFDEVVLVDVVEGLAAGVALDLTHSAPLLGFTSRVRGETRVADAGPADYVVLTAGRARTPGMSRTDLTSINADIVGGLAADVAASSPDCVLVVVSNPLDEMTEHAWRISGFPERRVLGMAGVLDTSRFQALASLSGIAPAADIAALALGSHGAEMVLPASQARAGGEPLRALLGADAFDAAVDRARNSGAEVVSLLKTGSAWLSPGLAAARMITAMVREDGALLTATARARGEYGIDGVYVGLPVRLGRGGLAEIVEVDLTPSELADLQAAAAAIAGRVAAL